MGVGGYIGAYKAIIGGIGMVLVMWFWGEDPLKIESKLKCRAKQPIGKVEYRVLRWIVEDWLRFTLVAAPATMIVLVLGMATIIYVVGRL